MLDKASPSLTTPLQLAQGNEALEKAKADALAAEKASLAEAFVKFYVNELMALVSAQSETDGVEEQTYLLFLEHSVALAQSASRISDITSLVLALVGFSSEMKGSNPK